MITMEQAYAAGPDGKVDMDLFQQFANQQNANLTPQGGTGSSMGNANLTLGQQYMAGNPDVQQDAIRRANAEGLTGGDAFSNRLDEIALEHFNNYGRAEGRTGYGYSAPAEGSFAPSPNDTPMFQAPSNQTSTGGLPGFAQPTFDTSQYDTAFQNALGNFNGLLDSYNDFFGDMMTNATNAQNQMPQYGGGFLPFATTLMPGGGSYQTTYNPFNTTTGSSFGGTFGSNSSFGNAIGSMPGQAANSSHRQWFTL